MKYITTQVWTDIPPLKLEPPILIRGFTNVSDGEYSRQVIILFFLVQSIFNWTDNISFLFYSHIRRPALQTHSIRRNGALAGEKKLRRVGRVCSCNLIPIQDTTLFSYVYARQASSRSFSLRTISVYPVAQWHPSSLCPPHYVPLDP